MKKIFFHVVLASNIVQVSFTTQDNLVELAEALRVLHGSVAPQYSIPSVELAWCTCISETDRLRFVNNVTARVEAKFPQSMFSEQRPLVYTSLASGGLLQDFKIIEKLLKDGYKNIIVNVIDFLYSYDNKDSAANRERIPLFQGLLADYAHGVGAHVKVMYYTTAYEYGAQVTQSKSYKKTDVFLMVDPDEALFTATSPFAVRYPSEANVLSYKNVYFFHSTAGGQIYNYGTKTPTTAIMYENMQEDPTISVSKLISKIDGIHVRDILLFAYPYTTLQDLVSQAASSSDALVFMLNKNPEIKNVVQITALSADDFLQKDVISPFIKKYIGSDYTRYSQGAF